MNINDLKLDLTAVDEGQWVGDIPNMPGVSFLVRGSDYEPYQAALRKVTVQDATKGRRNRIEQLRGHAMDPAAFVAAMSRATAEHLLLGWDGFDQEFSPELAMAFMTDRAYVRLKEAVQFAVEVVDAGAADHREETSGN